MITIVDLALCTGYNNDAVGPINLLRLLGYQATRQPIGPGEGGCPHPQNLQN